MDGSEESFMWFIKGQKYSVVYVIFNHSYFVYGEMIFVRTDQC